MFWYESQMPHCTELNMCQMPGDCPGEGMGGFGIDWYINIHKYKEKYFVSSSSNFIYRG